MSYGGDGYSGYSRGGSRRGRRGRARAGGYHDSRPKHPQPQGIINDPAITIVDPKIQQKKPVKKTEETKQIEIEDEYKYSKAELLEMFASVNLEKATKIMKDHEELDLVVSLSQTPVLLCEEKPSLTLEDLKSRKGYGPRRGGRNDFGKEKAPDDYDDDMDPEWLDGFDASKKFDFSKQVPLKKMFGEKDGVELEELGGLEDDETEDKTEDNANIQKPISIDEIEKKQLSKFEISPQPQFPQPQQDFGQFGFNQPGVNPQGFMPQAPDAQGFNPNMMQPQPGFQQPGVGGHPPAGQNPGFGAQPGFGPTHGQDFGGPFGGFQQPPMQDFNNPVGNPMSQGFGGFGGEAFGGFNQPFSNPMDSFGGGDMGFGSSLFGAPAGRDEEFEKIFGQPSAGPPGNEKLFHSHNQPSKGQQPGMFGGYGVDQNQFMQTNDDDDEEDDWLMDDQFQSKNLEFIDQHQDTPIKGSQNLPKVGETIDVAYKYVKTEKKRIPKPRKAHVFKPRLREKKRFEKMFDKEIKEETNNKKPHQQDVDMVLVKKFWDMKRDPTDLEMLNLIQNPFSFHVVNKRSSPPQFYLNKDGPIHIGELFMWFNQGLVPKTFQIGHDENCYKYNSRQ